MTRNEPVCRLSPLGNGERTRIGYEEEGFLLLADGSVHTLLPGETAAGGGHTVWSGHNAWGGHTAGGDNVPAGKRACLARIGRQAEFSGVAGAGDIPWGDRRTAGGWYSFRCRLLSPRRFAVSSREALLEGKPACDILTGLARQSLSDAIRETAGPKARSGQVWQACRRALGTRLLDLGWELDDFAPQRLRISREAG